MKSLGRYKIVRKLARGKLSDVYLARRDDASGFSRSYAIKALSNRVSGEGAGDVVRAFLREARIHGMLAHPNIASVIDVHVAQGKYYMVVEHVPGRNLRSVMASLALRRRVVSIDVGMSIAHGVAAALHHAHMLGIVHRDVSPSNVVVSEEGYVKLLDWGSAIAVEEAGKSRPFRVLTATRYSSPEVIWNHPVDPRADVYSLGVILYELTTGKRLFDGEDPIKRIAAGDIPKPSSVRRGYPSGLEAVIQRAVANKPDDRFQTAGDLKLALETLATEHKLSMSDFRVAGFLADIFNNDDVDARPAATARPVAPKPLAKANRSTTGTTGKTRIWISRKRAG